MFKDTMLLLSERLNCMCHPIFIGCVQIPITAYVLNLMKNSNVNIRTLLVLCL